MNEGQQKDWPAHYSAEDVVLIERISVWMQQHGYKQATLARLARISASALNQILGGKYATPPGKLLVAVESAMRFAEEAQASAIAPVETSVFQLAQTACQLARRYRNFGVLSANVGTGKTIALKHYAARHPNTYLIEAEPTMTVQSLVRLLARQVSGFTGRGSVSERFNAIVDTLKDTDSLIIVDEAETLTPHQLHTLRRIRDLANVGVVLSGTEYLSGLIKPEHGQFDQIRSRVGFFPPVITAISPDDSAALVQAALGREDIEDAVLDRLHRYCRGSARMLVEGFCAGIKEFRKGRALDVRLVDAVAKQVLCLQSLA